VPEDYVVSLRTFSIIDGNRHFTDATKQAAVAMDPRQTKTLGVAVLDYDGDGWPDCSSTTGSRTGCG
jgi:hypothetical protein